ncbi:hypothetical protein Tco_1503232 [Tanacetum coccineum]
MATVCSEYSGWIATLIPFSVVDWLEGGSTGGSDIILHSAGIMVLLCSVTIPSLTRNLSIPCAVEGIDWIFQIPGLPMIPLYGDGDHNTMKFIQALVECSASPSDTINDICPNGQDISPLNPKSGVVAGVIWFLICGRSLLKQCSYRTSEAEPPSTYMQWMRCPISASITIRLSYPSSLSSGGNEISGFVEKL